MREDELKAIARRLRLKERLSLGAIARSLGIAKSTASLWLADLRLTKCEERVLNVRGTKPKSAALPSPDWRDQLLRRKFTKKQAAQLSEAAILYRLCLCGFEPYRSPFDGDTSDWLVLVGKKYLRLQVKSVMRGGTGRPLLKLWRITGHEKRTRYSDEIDFIVGYDRILDVAYVYDFQKDLANNKTTVSVSEDAAEAWHKLRE
jgi:hypothetical protein